MTGAGNRSSGRPPAPSPGVRAAAGPPPLLVVPILLGLAILVGCGAPGGTAGNPGGVEIKQQDAGAFRGAEAELAKPTVTLTDTDGAPFDLATDTTAPVTLIFFGYTNCPDVCSIVLREIAAALNKLDEATRERIEVVFITTDPERDTPEAITAYLDRFNFAAYVGLTGSISTIKKAAVPLQVEFYKEDEDGQPGGPYEVAHGAHVIGFGTNGTSVLWTQGTPVADLAHDFALLAA